MRRSIEVSAKKVDEAIAEGLKKLDLTIDDVDVKIISSGGLLRKAKVEIFYGKEIEEAPVKPAVTQPTENAVKSKEPVKKVEPAVTEKKETPLVKTEEKKAKPYTPPATDTAKPAPQKKRQERNREESAQPTAEQVERVRAFLTELLQKMNISAEVGIEIEDGIRIEVKTENSAVIGHRGETLDALQYLCSLVVNASEGKFVHVSLDGLGYRAKRKSSLENLARRMADKAIKTGRRVSLEPMNSSDRRVIHAALGESEQVTTRSEGHEPSRRVIITPRKRN